MFSVTSVLLLSVGVVFVFLSIVERWILINRYLKISESSWFFWGMSLPYIEHPEGIKEFVKYRSKMFLIIGSAYVVSGVVFIPFPDSPLLLLVWVLSLVTLSLYLRATFIDMALDIRRKYIRVRQRPKKVCPKCGREMWIDFKICPGCGEKLFD